MPPSPSCPPPPIVHQNSLDPAASWIVQKYGGTSVGKFAAKICEDIVPRYLEQHPVAIVCSARSGSTKDTGTTNLLIRAATEALNRKDSATPTTTGTTTPVWSPYAPPRPRSFSEDNSNSPRPTTPSLFASTPPAGALSDAPASMAFTFPAFHATIDLIRNEHIEAARDCVRDPILLSDLEIEIDRDLESLRSFLCAAQVIDEVSPRSKDAIVGVGEKLACKLVATILRDRGVDSEVVCLDNIVAPDESDIARLDDTGQLDQDFYDRLAVHLGERIRHCGPRVPVVTGFFGPVPGSLLRQIGRGYTDLTSALLAVGLQAFELQIWKEVDGIFTADPRKVPTARLIPTISPDEAAELTYYGSEVIHPFTMEQVIRRKIPIRIKNVKNPLGRGTVIYPDPDPELDDDGSAIFYHEVNDDEMLTDSLTAATSESPRLPTAVTIKESIVALSVHSNRKTLSHGFLAKIFQTLDQFGVVVDLISTSEVHVSMAIGDALEKRTFDRLVRDLKKSGTVTVQPGMAILSLVGKQMRKMVGISASMFGALAQANVNIEMISQGASEINISCVIDAKDSVKALNAIHQTCLHIRSEGVLSKINGHVNGVTAMRGNGLVNGHPDGPDNGKANGIVNGKINDLANRHVVGLTSGHVNCDIDVH